MSRVHYISASKELPLGEFGPVRLKSAIKEVKCIKIKNALIQENSIPLEDLIDLSHISQDETEIYETEEDATGIFISEIEKDNELIKKQFKNQNVYYVSSCWGDFFISSELNEYRNKINKKCINELFKYIKRNLDKDSYIEIYTCFIDEEGEERNPNFDTVIDLKGFELGDEFMLKDKQYILVTDTTNLI